jgi:hypothetical protein
MWAYVYIMTKEFFFHWYNIGYYCVLKILRVCMYVCVGEVKASLVNILKKGPKTIQDFKAISQEEGVAIAD